MYPERFRINSPKVIHEIFDDEAIVINLDTGDYYSLNRLGAEIWTEVIESATVRDIIKKISSRYSGNEEDIEGSAIRFLTELEEEHLIQPVSGQTRTIARAGESPTEDRPESARPRFQEPNLQKFTDMQDVMLADPIHGFDDKGWPGDPDRPSSSDKHSVENSVD